MQLQQIIPWLLYLVAWYAYAVSFMSPVGAVFAALLLPYFVMAVIAGVLGLGVFTAATLSGVLWFPTSIGLGLRFGTWRGLYLAALPGGLWAAIFIVAVYYQLGESSVELVAIGILFLTSIWLAGIAVGVHMRKFVFRRAYCFPRPGLALLTQRLYRYSLRKLKPL